MINFKEIEILGLFGETDVKIPIKDNRLILVGYNGIGKSTVLNMFYYFISQQWSKLDELDFSSISIRVKNNNRKLTVERRDLEEFVEIQKRRRKFGRNSRFPLSLIKRAQEILQLSTSERSMNYTGSIHSRMSKRSIDLLRDGLGVPAIVAQDLAMEVRFLAQGELELEDETASGVAEVDVFLSEHLQGRVLFLPTYRRIEKDIKTVFPEIEDEIQSKLTRRARDNLRNNNNYIELVQFGMEDVKSKISSRVESVRSFALSQINSLTTKYLRDVIRDEATKHGSFNEDDINQDSVRNVFTKVDSAILSDRDKEKITEVVAKIQSGGELLENEKYVAHYVMYLVEVGKNISELERPIVSFIEICNTYLYGKSFHFDNVAYEVVVKHKSGRSVEMEELSSGEKQIVSLFSHLVLDDEKSNYIIIDEPELSLSVDWQQKFLEDISDLSSCQFIGAVTHSPFIFENSLEKHSVDLLEQMRSTL